MTNFMISYSILMVGTEKWISFSDWDEASDGESSSAIAQIKIDASQQSGQIALKYCVYSSKTGWSNWVSNGSIAGKSDNGAEGFALMVDDTENTGIGAYYQAYVESAGWLDPCSNGGGAGTSGQSKKLERLRIMLSSIKTETFNNSITPPPSA